MKIVYSDKHAQHDPQTFFVRGVKQRSAEQPERAERLLAAAKDVLATQKIMSGALFLSGWSQGGWATMAPVRAIWPALTLTRPPAAVPEVAARIDAPGPTVTWLASRSIALSMPQGGALHGTPSGESSTSRRIL